MNRQKIANGFLTAALFLLPWQTILLYRIVSLPEGATVYGNLGVYFTEVLIAVAFFLSQIGRMRPMGGTQNILRAGYFFFAACFLSLGYSYVFAVSLGFMVHVIAGGMLFLLLLDDRTEMPPIVSAFLAGLVAPCILGWFQYFTGFSPELTILGLAQKHVETSGVAVVATDAFRSLRAYGPFPHPNIFGGYLAIAIMLLGWQGLRGSQSLHKTIIHLPTPPTLQTSPTYMLQIVLFTSILILTFSRSAWLALAIGGLVGWHVARGTRPPPNPLLVKDGGNMQKKMLCIFFATVLLMGIFLHTHIEARFNPALHVEAISIEERATQYQTFFHVLPPLTRGRAGVGVAEWLFGVGPGAYTFALEAIAKGQPAWSYQPIHNAFLLLLAEIGIVGFAAFGYFVFEVLRIVLPLLSKERAGGEVSRSKWRSGGRIFATTLLLELFILALFDHYAFSMWPGIALTAMVFAISLRLSNEN